MNILYITPSFPFEKDGNNIYTDLAEELSKKHNIKVVVATEKRKINQTQVKTERGFLCLRVKIGNLYNVNVLKKAVTFITLQRKLKKAINKFFSDAEFDLILFMAPPITLGSVVKYVMKKYNAVSYLMQKDIFPQNAVDLKMMSKKNPAYLYFRIKEKMMYENATVIGCMSQGNIEYLLEHNKYLKPEKMEIFPNAIKFSENENGTSKYNDIRKKFNIPEDNVLAIYGGNFGKPQGIEFIKKVVNEYRNSKKVTFLFFGKGTEKKKLYDYIKEEKIKNALTFDFIPKEDYFQVVEQADIGLVFLNYKFTIPNIPSRTLTYFQHGLPIMAATDKNTDYKDILKQTESGVWCESNNIEDFKKQFDRLIEDKELRHKMGENGRNYLKKELTVSKSVEILEKAYKRVKKEK